MPSAASARNPLRPAGIPTETGYIGASAVDEFRRWRFVGLRVRTLVLAGYADFAWTGGKTVVFSRIPKNP